MTRFVTKILLATEGSHDAALAALAAADIARYSPAELHLIHAWHSLPSTRFESYIRTHLHQQAQEVLDEQLEQIHQHGVEVTHAHLKEGQAVDEILDLAQHIEADLIVIGSRGLGAIRRVVVGSVSEGVVHHASRPVLVLRGGSWPPERVVIGDDGSQAAQGAGEMGAALGKLFGSKVLVVRAYSKLPEMDLEGRKLDARMVDDELRRGERKLEERARDIEEAHQVRPLIRLSVGDPAACLLEAAEEGDSPEKTLVAVGSRGLGTMGRMRLGSVSTKVLRAAKGPMLIDARRADDAH